ncbi:MAG: ATP phosphoribosyltransferase regulatory subunit [Ardenticatenia bacterium]|nr:ATP phosphoribosyltransferase regulatory subunit [Ardenticatenia bacterium]
MQGILSQLETPPPNLDYIHRAIDRKNRRVLAHELDRAGLHGRVREALEGCLQTSEAGAGGAGAAARLAPNGRAQAAIERLEHVYTLTQAYGVAHRITPDLRRSACANRTALPGITFEVFAPGSGHAIAAGGRYDTLLERYGPSLPAVGFAVQVELVLLILERKDALPDRPPADALMACCGHAACLADLRARRALGERILLDVCARPPKACDRELRRWRYPTVLICGQQQEVPRG